MKELRKDTAVLSALLFGVFHIGSPGVTLIGIINIVMMGVLLGIAYALTGRLAMPVGIHIAWNLLQGNVFGFPVSGTTSPAPRSSRSVGCGRDSWAGLKHNAPSNRPPAISSWTTKPRANSKPWGTWSTADRVARTVYAGTT